MQPKLIIGEKKCLSAETNAQQLTQIFFYFQYFLLKLLRKNQKNVDPIPQKIHRHEYITKGDEISNFLSGRKTGHIVVSKNCIFNRPKIWGPKQYRTRNICRISHTKQGRQYLV